MAMSLGLRNGSNGTVVEMNTTPLIDVMLVLLVMLIVTIPMQTHVVNLYMPQAVPTEDRAPIHTLAIDFDGAINWDGAAISVRQLNDAFAKIAQRPVQDEIHVLPDRLANYGLVAQILADAQRAGVKRIGFAGEEKYLH